MAGPVDRESSSHYIGDDGRWHHTFRQSTLGDLDECAERGRLLIAGELPRIETDAAAVGTACHSGFEWLIEHGFADVAAAIDHAQFTFNVIAALPNFEWKKYSETVCLQIIEHVVDLFAHKVLPDLDPIAVEIPFDGLVIHEDAERVIMLNGTIDYFDGAIGGVDWKTAGDDRKYKAGFGGETWKLDRWNIQSSAYTFALKMLGFLDDEGPWPFTFYGFTVPYGGLQIHSVHRSPADHSWLAEKCVAWAVLIEADVSVWPKQDNQALCSPKWCPAWSACKGKHFEEWPIKWKGAR